MTLTPHSMPSAAIVSLIQQQQWRSAWNALLDHSLALGGPSLHHTHATLQRWDVLPVEAHTERQKLLTVLAQQLHDASARQPLPQAARPYLRARELVKAYRDSNHFRLGPINLDVKAGEIAGLVGENGNGKTTLLRLLAADLEKTSGEIDYGLPTHDPYRLRSQLIYIPQRPASWAGRLMDQLQFTAACYGIAPADNQARTELVVARLGLRGYRHLRWSELSSGYKMRFELARALLQRPQILLLDEPLANLDINAQQTLLSDLQGLAQLPWQPIALIMSSQQLYEVEKIAQQVIFLDQGKQRSLSTLGAPHSANLGENPSAAQLEHAIEFETPLSRDALQAQLAAMNALPIHRLQQNGHTYLLSFDNQKTTNEVLALMLQHGITLSYFRDISRSTRRLFVKDDV